MAAFGRSAPDEQHRDAFVAKAGRIRDLLARHGIECPTVTGAGTGSFGIGANRVEQLWPIIARSGVH